MEYLPFWSLVEELQNKDINYVFVMHFPLSELTAKSESSVRAWTTCVFIKKSLSLWSDKVSSYLTAYHLLACIYLATSTCPSSSKFSWQPLQNSEIKISHLFLHLTLNTMLTQFSRIRKPVPHLSILSNIRRQINTRRVK